MPSVTVRDEREVRLDAPFERRDDGHVPSLAERLAHRARHEHAVRDNPPLQSAAGSR